MYGKTNLLKSIILKYRELLIIFLIFCINGSFNIIALCSSLLGLLSLRFIGLANGNKNVLDIGKNILFCFSNIKITSKDETPVP